MSQVTAKNLFESTQLTNAAATYYTSPTSTRTIIDKLTATNVTGGSVTVTIYLVPSAGSASASNKVIDTLSIAANTCRDFTEIQNQILEAGDMIQALAGAGSSINLRGSGRQVK